jgi:hypothetical protein
MGKGEFKKSLELPKVRWHEGFRFRDRLADGVYKTFRVMGLRQNPGDPSTLLADLCVEDNNASEPPDDADETQTESGINVVIDPEQEIRDGHPYKLWLAENKGGVIVAGGAIAVSTVSFLVVHYRTSKE